MNHCYEYNTPIPFKGDIIITDPCYLMRKEEDSLCFDLFPKIEYPHSESFYKYGLDQRNYPDCKKQKKVFKFKQEFLNELTELYRKGLISFDEVMSLMNNPKEELVIEEFFSKMYQEANHLYHEAIEKYRSVPHDDWDYCDAGEEMEVLGFTHSAVTRTLYGDWSCTTFKIEDEKASAFPNKVAKEPLGHFCADAGLVGVFLVDEVMKYNPEAIQNLKKKKWCATFIDGFEGTISFEKVLAHFSDEEESEEDYDEEEIRLVGDGNIKFVTSQTGF